MRRRAVFASAAFWTIVAFVILILWILMLSEGHAMNSIINFETGLISIYLDSDESAAITNAEIVTRVCRGALKHEQGITRHGTVNAIHYLVTRAEDPLKPFSFTLADCR